MYGLQYNGNISVGSQEGSTNILPHLNGQVDSFIYHLSHSLVKLNQLLSRDIVGDVPDIGHIVSIVADGGRGRFSAPSQPTPMHASLLGGGGLAFLDLILA